MSNQQQKLLITFNKENSMNKLESKAGWQKARHAKSKN